MCPTSEDGLKAALFYASFVWSFHSDLDTGNYVPKGETAPSKVAESRVRSVPDNACQFSYGVDTSQDKSIWFAQQAFEDHVQANATFNKAKKPRRAWQDGNGDYMSTFVMSSQVFVRRTRLTSHREKDIDYELHPWIAEVTKGKGAYFANPDKPKLFELRGDELQPIDECTPPYLRKGDLVWISFSVEFIPGSDAWSTTFVPYEIVRVGAISQDFMGGSTELAAPRRQLKVGLKIVRSTCHRAC
ncbi:hypothetical protein FKP32DRAFT_1574797 [Trametes sanguinea]|nr:hypothetical protein FKP32DRAFT_1574797 [Trametes sanguinea]